MIETRRVPGTVGVRSIHSNAFGPIADDFLSDEFVDLLLTVTELAQDLGVVLAEHRRRVSQPVVGARESERRAHRRLPPNDRMLDFLHEAARDKLRVLAERALIDDGRGRYAGGDQIFYADI